jgi:hypothetical protein
MLSMFMSPMMIRWSFKEHLLAQYFMRGSNVILGGDLNFIVSREKYRG